LLNVLLQLANKNGIQNKKKKKTVMCIICILCLIIVLLPQGKNPFAVKINNNKEDYKAE
jgi:hypothetical protein